MIIQFLFFLNHPTGSINKNLNYLTLEADCNIIIIIIIKNRERGKVEENQRQTSDAQCNSSPPTDQCPSHAPAGVSSSQPILPSLYTEHEVLWYGISIWPIQVTSSGQGVLHFSFLCICSLAKCETVKVHDLGRHNLTTPKISMYYKHHSHTESKTQPSPKFSLQNLPLTRKTIYEEENLLQPKPGHLFQTLMPASEILCVLLVGMHRKQLCISLGLLLCALLKNYMCVSIR